MNINQASKASGLSPSVLRIWELRYGWPSPKRKPNGYRTYSIPQVEDLCRISELVKHGMSISQLIYDGLPRWPTDQVNRKAPTGLQRTKTLPRPAGHMEAKIQSEIIDALERRLGSTVHELLQRAMWSVRPQDEVLTALAPILIGLAELDKDDCSLPEADALRQQVINRCQQLLRRFQGKPFTWVVPATVADRGLAALVALVLSQQGELAQPWLAEGKPSEATFIRVGERAAKSVTQRTITLTNSGNDSLFTLLSKSNASSTPRPAPSAN